MSTQTARGPRGDYNPGHGDITGNRWVTSTDRKAEQEQARRATLNALAGDEPCLVVKCGPRSYLVPRVAVDTIRAED